MQTLVTLVRTVATPLYNPYTDTATKLKTMDEHIALVSAACGYVPIAEGTPDYVTECIENMKKRLVITPMTKFGMQMISQKLFMIIRSDKTDEEKLEECSNMLVTFIEKITTESRDGIIVDLIKCNEVVAKENEHVGNDI